MARMTAEMGRQGRAPWLRAIEGRASGLGSGLGSNIREARYSGSSVRTGEVLGAPGRAGAAHIVQFRPVGVERPGHELAPEGAEFRQRLGRPVAVRRGGEGCRTDRSHDASPWFHLRLLPP